MCKLQNPDDIPFPKGKYPKEKISNNTYRPLELNTILLQKESPIGDLLLLISITRITDIQMIVVQNSNQNLSIPLVLYSE